MFDKPASDAVLARIRAQVRITVHAHQQMVEEAVTMDELLQAASSADILEDYPEHRRGPCCLLHGVTTAGRHLHVVCTTSLDMLAVYEPRPPKWPEPAVRRKL